MDPENSLTQRSSLEIRSKPAFEDHRTKKGFDLGSESLYQLISDKLLDIFTSKLCVLAVGFSSAVLSQFLALGRKDSRRKVILIIADREEDQIVINDRMALIGPTDNGPAPAVQSKLGFGLATKVAPSEDSLKEPSKDEKVLKKRKPTKKGLPGEDQTQTTTGAHPEVSQMESMLSLSNPSLPARPSEDTESIMNISAETSLQNPTSLSARPSPTGAAPTTALAADAKPKPAADKPKRTAALRSTNRGLFVDFLSTNNTKQQRTKHYERGGVFLSSSTKFCLDLVEQIVDPATIDKIIVVNQYEAKECSPLSLGINILHRYNPVSWSANLRML